MKIYHKRRFVTALIATVIAVTCIIAYFITEHEVRFMIAFFLALVFAGVEYAGSLSKNVLFDELETGTDERDAFITMKTSWIAVRVLNVLLLAACAISMVIYAIGRSPICMTVMITLCVVLITLFGIVLGATMYYEKHN